MSDLASRITEPGGETAASSAAPPVEEAPVGGLGGPGLWDSENNVQVKLSDLQQDQDTPFYSAKSFEDLDL
jgi:ATP-dependent RNA helicase DDX19/DBP5